MKFLATEIEIRLVDPEKDRLLLQDEARALHRLYTAGFVREFYFTPGHDAILILECDSAERCVSILETLPLVAGKFIRFEITELRPYTGFERLFS